jgi:hypothetical protein
LALVGQVIDGIKQLCGLDLEQCMGLVQFGELHFDMDGHSASTTFPAQRGWWRSPEQPASRPATAERLLSVNQIQAALIDAPPVAAIGIADLEHFLLTHNSASEHEQSSPYHHNGVTFGMEVVRVRPGKGASNLIVEVQSDSGSTVTEEADLLIIATGGGTFHWSSISKPASNISSQGGTLLADLEYSLLEHPAGLVTLHDVAWSAEPANHSKRIGAYGNTGYGSFTGVAADFPDFSKATVVIPTALEDDVVAQERWIHAVADAMRVVHRDHEVVFRAQYQAFQSRLTSMTSPVSPFVIALGDAYSRTTPMNGKNFQTAIPALMQIADLFSENSHVLSNESEWAEGVAQIDNSHAAFVDKILAISDVIGRPIDESAFKREAASLSFGPRTGAPTSIT